MKRAHLALPRVLALALVSGACSSPSATRASASASAAAPPSASASSLVASAAPPTPSASASADAVTGASNIVASTNGSVVTSGAVDGAALRKKHRDRIAADTSPVTVLKGDSALDLGERICEAVVPKKPADTPVLLKPNICGIDNMKDPTAHAGDDGVKGRTTDPEFVRGVVHCLKARGVIKITIAEGCGLDHKTFMKLLDVSGYAAMAKDEGVALVGMNDDGTFDKEGTMPGKPLAITGIDDTPVPKLLMPAILAETLEKGMFISLPKIKTHRFGVVSLATKGMQGTVMTSDASPAYQQKWRMHKELMDYLRVTKPGEPEDRAAYVKDLELFADRMAAVLEIEAPDVVLAEGAPAEGGDGFQTIVPLPDNVAIGGTNPVAVDKVGAEFLGLWNSDKLALGLRGHKTSPLIEAAGKLFGVRFESVTTTGDGADLLGKPRPVHFQAIAPFGIDVAAPSH